MIIEKQYIYAREPLVTRICPVCKYECHDIDHRKGFIPLEKIYAYDRGSSVKLYACPKCGTVGIDIEEKQ